MARPRLLQEYAKIKIGLDARTREILKAEAERRHRSISATVRLIVGEWSNSRGRDETFRLRMP